MFFIIRCLEFRKGESSSFHGSLMWASSKQEAERLREEWYASQPEEEKEYIIREAEILMPHPEKPGEMVNHLWRPPYREECYFE